MSRLRFTLDPKPFWSHSSTFSTVSQAVIHPDYSSVTVLGDQWVALSDLAVLKLGSRDYGPQPSQFLKLASASSLSRGTRMMAVGYGANPNGSHSQRRASELIFVRAVDGKDKKETPLPDALVGVAPTAQSSVCQGDSGGPLLARAPNGVLEIFGIASVVAYREMPSHRNQCGVSLFMLYTGLGPYREWIRETQRALETKTPAIESNALVSQVLK